MTHLFMTKQIKREILALLQKFPGYKKMFVAHLII